MKKALYYLPAVMYTAATMILNVILNTFVPLWLGWAALLWLSGFLLSKGKVWGGFIGLLPAVHILYMSIQETGQVVSEAPLGIITAVYVLACMLAAWRKGTSK